MAKLTLEEKRLQQIRMQLFGKDRPVQTKEKSSRKSTNIDDVAPTPVRTSQFRNPNDIGEARFLKQDLTKVVFLSGIILSVQFILYYFSLQGIIDLNVFHLF